jgi:hypothetical protein
MKKYLFLFLGLLCFALPAHASFNGYTYQRTITVSSTLVAPVNGTSLSNFPILVSSTLSDLASTAHSGTIQNLVNDPIKGTSVKNKEPADLIFTTDSGCNTTSSWEIENYNSSTGEIEAWVRDATLSSSTGLTFYMCYDNSSISTWQTSSTATWNSNIAQVFHMNESTGTKTVYDSTKNAFNGTMITDNTSQVATSTHGIDGDFDVPGTGAADVQDNSVIASGHNYSFSFWAYLPNVNLGYVLDNNANGRFVIAGGEYAPNINSIGIYNGTSWVSLSPANSWPNNTLKFISLNYDKTNNLSAGYINGVAQSTSTAPLGFQIGGNPTCLFDNYGCAAGSPNAGYFDEFRVYNTTTTADWIRTDYNTEGSPSTFLTISAASGGGGGVTNYDPFMLADNF